MKLLIFVCVCSKQILASLKFFGPKVIAFNLYSKILSSDVFSLNNLNTITYKIKDFSVKMLF